MGGGGPYGTGRPLAQRLLADRETVWDVPAKLAARVRVFDTGNARKTDAQDAHAIAMVALRTGGLRELTVDERVAVLRLLADRRDELSRSRAQILNRLHRLLAELVPGGAKRHLSLLKAKALLASVRPRDLAGKTRRQLAVAVDESGSHLMNAFGIGPAEAARILADVGDIARFPTATTSPPGPAPHPSTPPAASRSDTGSPGPATAG